MRLSFSLLSGLLFLCALLANASPAPLSPSDLSKVGIVFKGEAEYDPEAYKKLVALRKAFQPATATRTKPFRGGLQVAKSKAGRRGMTNAKRLALGLPLNPPVRRSFKGRYSPFLLFLEA